LGPMWIATPSSYRTCTDYSLPVSRRTAKDSARYRNRSPSPVALGLFGRIVPSDATTESRFAIRRNPNFKLQASGPSNPETLQTRSRAPQRNRLPLNDLDRFTSQLYLILRIKIFAIAFL
jgi:hypothetical protein